MLDDLTGSPVLAKDRLLHGQYYIGRCRNATIARWNADDDRFYHWRERFGQDCVEIIIETINYPGDGPFDVFFPVMELPNPKFEIPFDGTKKAEFSGNRDDLYEHHVEMWNGLLSKFRTGKSKDS